MQAITLKSGHTIPQLGLGTWQLTGDSCADAVTAALRMGYRHIDTAFAYQNHRQVGAGIARAGVPREEIFLTTKIPLNKQRPAQVQGLGRAMLEELGTDYVDLLLIHWPDRNVALAETLGAMAELVNAGRVRSIGISNFNAQLVQLADSVSPVPIVTNQVEFHPFLYQKALMDACRALDIRITAYSPIAQGAVLHDTRLQQIARVHDVAPTAVALAWLMSKDIIIVPKASSETHLRANLEAAELRLAAGEIATIDSFPDHRRLIDGPWKHFPLE